MEKRSAEFVDSAIVRLGSRPAWSDRGEGRQSPPPDPVGGVRAKVSVDVCLTSNWMNVWEIPVRENYVPVYPHSKYRYAGPKNTG